LNIPDINSSDEKVIKLIGEILVKYGHITTDDIEFALDLQKESSLPIGEILISEGIITNHELYEALGAQIGVEVIHSVPAEWMEEADTSEYYSDNVIIHQNKTITSNFNIAKNFQKKDGILLTTPEALAKAYASSIRLKFNDYESPEHYINDMFTLLAVDDELFSLFMEPNATHINIFKETSNGVTPDPVDTIHRKKARTIEQLIRKKISFDPKNSRFLGVQKADIERFLSKTGINTTVEIACGSITSEFEITMIRTRRGTNIAVKKGHKAVENMAIDKYISQKVIEILSSEKSSIMVITEESPNKRYGLFLKIMELVVDSHVNGKKLRIYLIDKDTFDAGKDINMVNKNHIESIGKITAFNPDIIFINEPVNGESQSQVDEIFFQHSALNFLLTRGKHIVMTIRCPEDFNRIRERVNNAWPSIDVWQFSLTKQRKPELLTKNKD